MLRSGTNLDESFARLYVSDELVYNVCVMGQIVGNILRVGDTFCRVLRCWTLFVLGC